MRIRARIFSTALVAAEIAAFVLPAAAAEKPKADLSRLAVVGDSLTAGFQDFSLFDGNTLGAPVGGQRFGYAAVVAKQANVKLAAAYISYPGFPPALKLIDPASLTLAREAGFGFRINPMVQPFNLSVPGYSVADALEHPFPGNPLQNPIDALSALVLGVPNPFAPGCGPIWTGKALVVSAVRCAVALKPSTVLVSLGNNDALQALTMGTPPTATAVFAAQYREVLKQLSKTKAAIAVANIPDVTAIPFLTPVPVFQGLCGFTPPGATAADFVVPNVVDPTQNTFSLCTNVSVRTSALVQQAQAAVTAYNAIIASEAKRVQAAVIDLNSLFKTIATTNYCAAGKVLTTRPFGGLFSLDGVHPTNTGYALLANEAIKTLNAEFRLSIPLADVNSVAMNDPLIPPTAPSCAP